jgi:hypothetical protein
LHLRRTVQGGAHRRSRSAAANLRRLTPDPPLATRAASGILELDALLD